ncbi:MAG: hypothetical protein WC705_00075 [Candidatus Paceibacterota bacterium]|jgi:hypothetical protein
MENKRADLVKIKYKQISVDSNEIELKLSRAFGILFEKTLEANKSVKKYLMPLRRTRIINKN